MKLSKSLVIIPAALIAFSMYNVAQADGAALYQAKTCWGCHGKDAKSPLLPIYPRLAGQSADYAFNQMKDIKSGTRANGQAAAMRGVMSLVDEAEMREIANWLATQ
ncbi:MAG: c-type cytochrome [Gammaproteobacteria bacterium]|nr:c-type cytochrome [Gammaproteobacteria bacterium]